MSLNRNAAIGNEPFFSEGELQVAEYSMPTWQKPEVSRFYTRPKIEIDLEAERLQSTAVKLANPISEEMISSFSAKGSTILDIGAGADASLGTVLKNRGYEYIAIEPNKAFVDILQKKDIRAYRGDVTNVPIGSNSVDAVHMRFLFGWLNEGQRKSALKQAVRVLKPGDSKAITIIDYDWLMTDGPDEYMEAVGIACDILDSFGFDYKYGSRMSLDIENLLAAQVLHEECVEIEVHPVISHEIRETLGDGRAMLEEAAISLMEGLNSIGDVERASLLGRAIDNLRNVDPAAEIALPGINVQSITVTKERDSKEQPRSKPRLLKVIQENESYSEDFTPTSIEGVKEVNQGSKLNEYVRRVQASEYLKNGMLTSDEMINEDGVLCEESYPQRYLDRSTLFVTLPDSTMKPSAAVRLIRTEANSDPDTELRSLPTAEHLGLSIADNKIFPEGAEASGVFEVSAFVRNSEEGGNLLDMTRVIVGLAAEAKRGKYHTGLMTTQEKMYGLVKKILGEENFTVLKGPHENDTPGASNAIKYVCLSVDIRTFLDGVQGHVAAGKDKSEILKDLSMILQTYYGYNQAA